MVQYIISGNWVLK